MKSKMKLKVICAIIILCTIGIILKNIDNKANGYFYNIKSNIMSKYDLVDTLYVKQYGPYCIIVVSTTKVLALKEAEAIFKDLLIDISDGNVKRRFIEQQRSSARSDLAFFKIEFVFDNGYLKNYSFSATNKDDFTIWTLEKGNNTKHNIQYNRDDYIVRE